MDQRYIAVPRWNGHRDCKRYAAVLWDLRQYLLETNQLEELLAKAEQYATHDEDIKSSPPEAA